MKSISAREAKQGFSALLSRVERGEKVLITKYGCPVAILRPYHPTIMTAERQRAIRRAIKLMAKGLPWGNALGQFTRDEMHE
jgi:prevent-host-death family protein